MHGGRLAAASGPAAPESTRQMASVRGEATDEMLMVRYQRGDREAFAELVRRYHVPDLQFRDPPAAAHGRGAKI